MDDEVLAHALVIVALLLTVLMFISFVSMSVIAWRLRSKPGGELALIMSVGTGFIAVAQLLRLLIAVLLDFNDDVTIGTLISISIMSQLIVVLSWVGLSVWTWILWREEKSDRDAAAAEGGEPGEGITV